MKNKIQKIESDIEGAINYASMLKTYSDAKFYLPSCLNSALTGIKKIKVPSNSEISKAFEGDKNAAQKIAGAKWAIKQIFETEE